MKLKTNKLLIRLWDAFVLIAYSLFYIFCVAIGALALLLTMVMIKELGGDYGSMGKEVQILLRVVILLVSIIITDKFFKYMNKHKKVEEKK